MNKYVKYVMIGAVGLILTGCSNSTYKIKQEKDKQVLKVPSWYMKDYNEKKECGTKTFGKGKDKVCIFGVGTSVSPDLELAIEKGMMIAKAELADKLEGQMNKRTDLYITEIGQEGNKEVVSKVEEVIVNVVKETMIQGYESWEKAVYETPNGEYRVYIGLKMGVGDANYLAEYIAKNANKVDVDTLAKNAIEKIVITNPDGIPTVE